MQIKVATYNIHHCSGLDARNEPSRIVKVLEEIGPDICGLQEVDSGIIHPGGFCQADFLAEASEMAGVMGPTIIDEGGRYGNLILTRGKIHDVRRLDLSIHRREPRGALDIDIELRGRHIRVISVHLGLRAGERRRQFAKLLKTIEAYDDTLLIMGDFNEWLPFSRSMARWNSRLGATPKLKTFPTRMPLLALDRVWVQPKAALVNVSRHVTPTSRIASDHLPLVATLNLGHSPHR